MSRVHRIGLTMRMTQEARYLETRDALSREWPAFMASALPDVRWMPIPNLGADSQAYFRDFDLDGLLLTGGSDLGADELRDETETALVHYCLKNELPVLGVCRGMQLLNKFFGGRLSRCDTETHVATSHAVEFTSEAPKMGLDADSVTSISVNSFHQWGVFESGRPAAMAPFAVAGDGSIEAFRHVSEAVVGIAWHPERETMPKEHDIQLFKTMFGPADASTLH